MISPKSALRWVAVGLMASLFSLAGAIELIHHHRFGHFLGYGWHVDVMVKTFEAGLPGPRRFYAMSATNLTLQPRVFQVVTDGRFGGLGCGKGVIYREQVQKWDSASQKWVTIPESIPVSVPQNAVPVRHARFGFELTTKTIGPGESVCAAGWDPIGSYRDLKRGDVARLVVFSLYTAPENDRKQRVLYSPDIRF